MGGVAKLAAYVVIHDKMAFETYVNHAADMLVHDADPTAMHDSNGWLKDEPRAFVVGDRVYRDGTDRKAAVTQEMRDYARELRPAGEFTKWQIATTILLSAGIQAQALGVLAAFAAPLMAYQAVDEGGTILSIVHGDTGTGKTTALQCGASVWGRWHFLNAKNVTHNFRMKKIGMLNNLPAFYDDLVTSDPAELMELVNIFTGGQDKGRLMSDSRMQRLPYTWATILCTSSNKSLVDLINLISKQAGAARILEIECGERPETPPQGADYFKDVFAKNYGWAGHAFLRYITHPKVFGRVLEMLKANAAVVEFHYNLPPQARFYTRILTCMMTAAQLVDHMKLVPSVTFLDTAKWACDLVSKSVEVRAARASEEERAQEAEAVLSQYIGDVNKDLMIVDTSQIVHKGLGYCRVIQANRYELAGRLEQDKGLLMVSQMHFSKWLVKNNHNIRETLAKLRSIGMLTGKRNVNFTKDTEFAGTSTPSFVFDISRFNKEK